MANNTVINAANNPDLANKLAAEILAEPEEAAVEEIRSFTAAPSGDVELLAGLFSPMTGELLMTAEVRELTGADEEAVAKAPDIGRGLMIILNRATTMVGDKQATPDLLDKLLAGDREYLLMAIRRVTFGDTIELTGPCNSCGTEDLTFVVDLETDVEVKRLEDPISDRAFTVKCKVGEVEVLLPNGVVQKKLIQNTDKTGAELDTILLKECISSINGMAIMDNRQILNLGLADRRKILREITDRNPGPRLSDIKKSCPVCEEEVTISLSLAELFLS